MDILKQNRINYAKAPIVEAIFDIQVLLETPINLEVFKKIHEEIREDFPKMSGNYLVSAEITGDPIKSNFETSSSTIEKGKVFSNPEKSNKVIQMREDGFTFNMQAPYTNWEDFSAQGTKYFDIYISYFPIKKISKASIRFINQFIVELPIDSFESITNCIPQIPKGLPRTFSNYFSQVQLPYLDEDILLSITHSTLKRKENTLPLLLDIDVIKFGNIEKENLNKIFNRLREIKNIAFENSLTEKTKNSFK